MDNENNSIHICEWCGKTFDIPEDEIKSKRFCCLKCKKSYISKKISEANNKRIANGTYIFNLEIYKKLHRKPDGWKCKDCDLIFETKRELYEHRYQVHNIKRRNRTNICPRCNQHYDGRLDAHRRICPAIRHDHKHTEETKKHLSEVRKKWLKEHPESHPWKRKDKYKSVPCEKLKDILRKDFNFVEEYTDKRWEHNYSIDIAFLDKKLGIEVNGDQHYNRDGTLIEYYQKRHNYLESQGWLIFEIYYIKCYKSNDIEQIKQSNY